MSAEIEIVPESPRSPGVDELLRLGAEYAESLYPPESNFYLKIDELEADGVTFYVARSDGAALGTAALMETDQQRVELKRMFVHPDARGRGVAGALLARLEQDARTRGMVEIVLETGDLHHAAHRLYQAHGYQNIPQFGQYVGEPHSVCMAKALG